MGNVLWHSCVMPVVFLSNPCVAFLSLIGCMVIMADRPERRLLQFLLPLGLSQALFVMAGMIPGKIPDASALVITFLCVEAILCGVLIYRLRRTALGASMIALFCVSYAFFAALTTIGSFQNTWL